MADLKHLDDRLQSLPIAGGAKAHVGMGREMWKQTRILGHIADPPPLGGRGYPTPAVEEHLSSRNHAPSGPPA